MYLCLSNLGTSVPRSGPWTRCPLLGSVLRVPVSSESGPFGYSVRDGVGRQTPSTHRIRTHPRLRRATETVRSGVYFSRRVWWCCKYWSEVSTNGTGWSVSHNKTGDSEDRRLDPRLSERTNVGTELGVRTTTKCIKETVTINEGKTDLKSKRRPVCRRLIRPLFIRSNRDRGSWETGTKPKNSRQMDGLNGNILTPSESHSLLPPSYLFPPFLDPLLPSCSGKEDT